MTAAFHELEVMTLEERIQRSALLSELNRTYLEQSTQDVAARCAERFDPILLACCEALATAKALERTVQALHNHFASSAAGSVPRSTTGPDSPEASPSNETPAAPLSTSVESAKTSRGRNKKEKQ